VHANQTLLNWLGTTQSEMKAILFPDLLFKGGRLYYNLFILPLLQLHTEVKEISFDIQTSAGSLPILFSAVALELNNSTETVINATIFKISDRKKFEEELLREKNLVEKEIEQKNSVLEEVAFNQSHLIRAPLANVIGLIAFLEEEPETSDQHKDIVKMLKTSALKLDNVIQSIVFDVSGK